jgi:2-polyprenyl-6-methoxyphenol hydroxylase-like FAD-dependent oxidoreductase
MRVLIAAAGIAGLTLSALLRQKSIKPQIVDRASDFSQAGYMLGLFPMGNRVLHWLGAFDAFVRRSEPMDTYALCNGHGETMQTFDLASALGKFGVTRQLSRADLLEILRDCVPDVPLSMGTRVTTLVEQRDEVEVFAGEESLGRFDLVVGADGIHSAARRHRTDVECVRRLGRLGVVARRTSW